MRKKVTWIYEANPKIQREWLWKKLKNGKWKCTLTRIGKGNWEPYYSEFPPSDNPIINNENNPDRYEKLTDEDLFTYLL